MESSFWDEKEDEKIESASRRIKSHEKNEDRNFSRQKCRSCDLTKGSEKKKNYFALTNLVKKPLQL